MRRLILLSIFALAFVVSASAQVTGLYSFGSFDNHGFDSVNIGNLNVHFSIPIMSKPGRGIPFYYNLSYDSLIWSPANTTGTTAWTPTQNFGWLADTATVTGYVTYETEGDPEHYTYTVNGHRYSLDCWNYTYQPFVYVDAFGVAHTFVGQTSDNTQCHGQSGLNRPNMTATAIDGSGYKISVTNYTNVTITGPTGRTFIPPVNTTAGAGFVTDTNGNQVTTDGNVFTDTLGTTALTVGGGGTPSSPRTLTYNVARQADSSTTATATVSYVTYNVQTNFGCSGIAEYGPLSNNLVDRVTLADGTYYQFTYESTPGGSGTVTGRLASVTLPTGGTINYQYSGGCNGNGLNADGTTGSINRMTSDGTRVYGRSPSANGSTTTLQDEVGNQTLYTFTNAYGWFYETHRQVYQGGVGASTPLLDRQTCYNTAPGPNCDGGTITAPITQTLITTSQNGGAQSQIQNTYSSTSGLLLGTGELDGSTLLRTTSYSYVSPGRISNVTVNDGTGYAVSQTTYGYDETPLTGTSGIPQHVAVSGPRGNMTSSHAWTGMLNNTLDTVVVYYDTGIPVSTADPNGTTQYTYDSTQGFATQVTPPTPSSGVPLPVTASFDIASGVMLSKSDVNNPGTPMTQYAHYDKLLRPIQINTVDGGGTTYSYGTFQGSQTLNIINAINGQTITLYDSYGRSSRLAIYNGSSDPSNNWYQVDSCYNATGQLQFQSTAYQSSGFSAAKQCSGNGTSYIYDALGRVTSIVTADGTASYQYNSRAVKFTDVNGIQKITQYDALGRISAICEVSGTSYQGESPVNCNLDIPGSGYLTTYSYDLVNHKTTITQGVQQRVFQTDALERSVYTKEPERGETSYSYVYNGTGLQVVRIRPKANQGDSNVKTNTVTQYDALGRVVTVFYDDGITPGKYFYYDNNPYLSWSSQPATNLKGHLSIASTSNPGTLFTSILFSYDSMGRVTQMWQCAPSICDTSNQASRPALGFGYDLAGNLTYEFDGVSGGIRYTRSPVGEVTSITNLSYTDPGNTPNLVSNVINGPFGPVLYDLGNGTSSQRWYDSMGRFSQQVFCPTSARNDCYHSQFYGVWNVPKGNRVIHTCDTVIGNCFDYGYDEFNRLTSMNSTSGSSQGFSYAYDRYGNRLSQTVVSGSGPNQSFSIWALKNMINGAGYDAAGNMTGDWSHSYVYDAEGNILQVDGGSTGQYAYDALNRRIRVQTASWTYEYLYDYMGHRLSGWLEPNNFGNQGRIYWDGRQIAYRAWNGTTYFDHQDWIGTERVRTNYAGAVSSAYTSLPWGDGYAANETSSTGDGLDNLHFAQLDHDTESNTEHAQFRNYSSNMGRWMSPDPYNGSYDFTDPQSFNRYSYVGNRPLSGTDPSGQNFLTPEDPLDPGDPGGWGDPFPFPVRPPLTPIPPADPGMGGGGTSIQPAGPGTDQSNGSPRGDIWNEHIGFPQGWPLPGGGPGDLLGLPGQGCEFGACGGNSFVPGCTTCANKAPNPVGDFFSLPNFWSTSLGFLDSLIGRIPSWVPCVLAPQTAMDTQDAINTVMGRKAQPAGPNTDAGSPGVPYLPNNNRSPRRGGLPKTGGQSPGWRNTGDKATNAGAMGVQYLVAGGQCAMGAR